MQLNLTVLEKLQYDALNRLVATTPSAKATSQRFYLKDRLTTEIQGTEQRSIMQHDDQLLAQQQRQSGSVETRLLVTDTQRSVLSVLDATRPHPIAYTPYGHRPLGNGLLSLLGFNGERPDPVTGWYLLGNGYRPFNPVLMRFNSPDSPSFSPFGKGGLNADTYCVGDPVNRRDPTGHTPIWLKAALRRAGLMRNRTVTVLTPNTSEAYRRSSLGPVDDLALSPLSEKTPAWTTQDRLAFAGTEARHPGAPSPASSQESLHTYSSNSPQLSDTDIQPHSTQQSTTANTPPRRRRGAVVVDSMATDISDLRARHGNGDLTAGQASSISDPPPQYSYPLPPPNYGNGPLPSYEQALVNAAHLRALPKQQSVIRK